MKKQQPNSFSWKNAFQLYLTGFAMGAADIVPGVSGGTVAFLMGIYEELIYSIKLMTGRFLQLVLTGKLKDAWSIIPFRFLVPVGLGIGSAVLSMANLISFLLTAYPSFLWSFFFGLVLASVVVVRKRVVTWDLHDYIALLATTIGTYFLVGAVPVETPNNPVMLFLSGAIAICAMILPGISGSFLLVIMGKYEQVLTAVTQFDLLTLVIFAAGTAVGIGLFSRLLSYLFAKHHDILIASLIGFMVGSLRKVWPWKETLTTRINSHGEVVPLLEKNILPSQIDGALLFSILLAVAGFALILLLDRLEATKEHTKDVDNADFEHEHQKALKSQKKHSI